MTRRVGEPSEERKARQGVWGVEDLRKRPAPLGGDAVIEVFRAVRYVTGITVSGPSQVVVDWDEWENSNASVFTPLDTTLNPADPGEVVRRVQFDLSANPGRYTFHFAALPGSNITGTIELAMHDGDPIWGWPDVVNHSRYDGGLGGGFLTFHMSRILPMYDPFSSGSHLPQISFTIAQNGAASETFSTALMEIHYERHVNFPA